MWLLEPSPRGGGIRFSQGSLVTTSRVRRLLNLRTILRAITVGVDAELFADWPSHEREVAMKRVPLALAFVGLAFTTCP